MRFIISLLFFLSVLPTNARSLEGKLLDEKTLEPISSATIYLSYTKINTTSLSDGRFTFPQFPSGRYELIVSCSGYKTRRIELISSALPAFLSISLTPLEKESPEFIDSTYEKDGWAQWGELFLKQLIGTSKFSRDTRLKNPEQVKFIYNKVTQTLIAVAHEPLLIENKAFGYWINFTLEHFEYQLNRGLIACKGYPLFREMENKRPTQISKCSFNRQMAYLGSWMHFFRSLYRNQLVEQGFEVRKIQKVVNEEYRRVKNLLYSRVNEDTSKHPSVSLFDEKFYSKDSIQYYSKIWHQGEWKDSILPELIPVDSIAYAIDSVTVVFFYHQPLEVYFPPPQPKYRNKRMNEIQFYYPNLPTINGEPLLNRIDQTLTKLDFSKNKLLTDKEIIVMANGTYFEPSYLFISGYWAYWEGISMLLPISYIPKHP
jgi:hypothetical protein